MSAHLHWGDVATWVAAVGTVGTLVAIVWQIRREQRLRREERHRDQASHVSALVGPVDPPSITNEEELAAARVAVDLINTSSEPVYRLVAGIPFMQGEGTPRTMEAMLEVRSRGYDPPIPITTVSVLPPGAFRAWVRGHGWGDSIDGRWGAEVGFTDRNGSHWVRRTSGKLEEIPEDPFEYFKRYGLVGPYDLQSPERLS
jgi:hypothetical protein